MGVNNEKKIVFLFGAGAEGKGQYGMPMGENFKKSIICKNDVLKDFIDKMNEKIDDESIEIRRKITKDQFLSYNQTSVLYQTIEENKDNDRFKSDFLDKINKNDLETINEYIAVKNDEIKDGTGKIANNFQEIYRKIIFKPLQYANKDDKKLDSFLKYACIYSYIDKMFNSLRHPSLYKVRTAKVIKLYYSAFLALFRENEIKIDDNLRTNLNGQVSGIIERRIRDNKNTDTYYKQIKKYKDENPNDSISVITTNYTELAEREIGLKYNFGGEKQNDEIAYLHGRLNLFENVFTKEVKDIESFNDNDFIMPFIMVQSGVKPIISPYQIKEFAKAIDFLENADIVVILGYGINSDDEHIQTMLRECLRDKEVYCFIHVGESKTIEEKEEEEKEYTKKEENAHKLFPNFIYKKTSEFEDFLKDLANKQ